MAWAFATLDHAPGAALLEALAAEAEGKLPLFSAQNVSNLLYAFAKLEHRPPATFLAAVSRAARPILPTFTPQVSPPYSCLNRLSHCQWALPRAPPAPSCPPSRPRSRHYAA